MLFLYFLFHLRSSGFSDLCEREVFAFGTGESASEGHCAGHGGRRLWVDSGGRGCCLLGDFGNHIDCLLCCSSLLLNVALRAVLGKGFARGFDQKVCTSGAKAQVSEGLVARLKSCPDTNHTSAAKAAVLIGLDRSAEALRHPKTSVQSSFSAACEVVPYTRAFMKHA